jgi:hypothetical protein
MATTVRSSSQNSASTGTAVSVSAPTGTAAGDLVVVVVHGNGQITIADNNGATSFTKASITGDDASGNYKPNPTSGQTAAIFTRRIQGGDPSTYNFTLSAIGRWGVVAVCFQNPHASTIFDVAPAGGNNADEPPGTHLSGTAASITTVAANAIDCAILCVDGGSAQTFTPPSGYAVEQTVAGTTQPIVFCDKVIASPTSTGTRSFSWTTSNAYLAISFAIADSGNAATTSAPPPLPARRCFPQALLIR